MPSRLRASISCSSPAAPEWPRCGPTDGQPRSPVISTRLEKLSLPSAPRRWCWKDAGLLEGRDFTAHSAAHDELPGVSPDRVVIDGNLITSRGAGTALDFGLALVRRLAGDAAADEVEKAIMA